MRKSTLCLLIISLVLLKGNAIAESIKILGIQAPSNTSRTELVEILQATDVSGRNLASITVRTSNEAVRKSLESQHGYSVYTAPAWFTKDWRLLETGNKFYVPQHLLSPRYSDLSPDANDYAPRRFPFLLVRDAYAESCPFVYGFPSQLNCLNEHLEVEEKFELPFVCNGYRIENGNIWVIGLEDGYLAHRFDLTKKELTDRAVPLKALLDALKRAGFESKEIKHLTTRELDKEKLSRINNFLESRSDSINKHTTGDEARVIFNELEKPLYTIPTSFQYDLATDGKKVGILLRKPMGLVEAEWPDGKNANFVPITKGDLPGKFQQSSLRRLYVAGLELAGGHFFAYYQTLAPMTYGEALSRWPDAAERIKQSHKDEQISLSDVVGQDMDYLGFRFEGSKAIALPWDWTSNTEWDVPSPIIFEYKKGQIWTPVTNIKNGWVRGIARIQ